MRDELRLRPPIVVYLLIALSLAPLARSGREPASVADCVQTAWIVDGEVKISPDVQEVAYLVRRAHIGTNRNIDQLLVRDLRERKLENGRVLLESGRLSKLTWLRGGRQIAVLSRETGKNRIYFIEVTSGRKEVAIEAAVIEDFAVDAAGAAIVYSVPKPNEDEEEKNSPAGDRGVFVPYGIPFEKRLREAFAPHFELYLAKAGKDGRRQVSLLDLPIGSSDTKELIDLQRLSLSPDGRYLTFERSIETLPTRWKKDPIVEWRVAGRSAEIMYLYDFRKGNLRIPFDAPDPGSPIWAGDSRSFAVYSTSPVESSWEQNDLAGLGGKAISKWGGPMTFQDSTVRALFHLFAVDVEERKVSLVLNHLDYELGPVLATWTNGSIEIECLADAKTTVRMVRQGLEWREIGRSVNPQLGSEHFANPAMSIAGNLAVGTYQSVRTAPDLYLYSLNGDSVIKLTDLNSRFRDVSLGEVGVMKWSNKYGAKATGYLIKPVGFETGRLYPLVIMAKTWNERFICDGFGSGETTAFPPQPLAGAGFVVLLVNDPSLEQQPTSFAGKMGEAYNWIETIRSSIEALAGQGMVDPTNVGIIGFSRTSWKTDFMLTHSDFRFRAASSADGGNYNYGMYWLFNMKGLEDSFDAQVGGPPFGDTFANWVKFAPPFNAEKVHCPILMEYTSVGGIVAGPFLAYEFQSALRHAGKVAELYFYPGMQHQLDTPLSRFSSLQRNVDWFRFWMQGYERPDPESQAQYVRWRQLRERERQSEFSASPN